MNKGRRHTDWEKKLLRYLSKEMSSEERHAFERELERDRFAYEATEGFDQINPDDVADDLSQLRSRTQPWRKSPVVMWKIAAGIALMMVAGISAWRLTTSETEPVADRTELAADSAVALNKQLQGEEPGEAEPTPAVADSQPADVADQLPLAAAPPASEGTGPAQSQASSTAGVALDRQAGEQIISEADEALSALSEDYLTEEEAIAEELSEGEFEAQAEAKPEVQKEALADALAEKTVAGSSSGAANETTVSGSEAEERSAQSVRKRSVGYSQPAETKDEAVPLKENAAPEMGWAEFEKYVKSNQRKEAGMKRGDVGLSFTVDPSGNPIGIEVVQPLCDICDKEAIRLLENSGKWSYYDNISGTPQSLLHIKIKK